MERTWSRLIKVEICCSRTNFSRTSPKAVWEDRCVVIERKSWSNRIAPSWVAHAVQFRIKDLRFHQGKEAHLTVSESHNNFLPGPDQYVKRETEKEAVVALRKCILQAEVISCTANTRTEVTSNILYIRLQGPPKP